MSLRVLWTLPPRNIAPWLGYQLPGTEKNITFLETFLAGVTNAQTFENVLTEARAKCPVGDTRVHNDGTVAARRAPLSHLDMATATWLTRRNNACICNVAI